MKKFDINFVEKDNKLIQGDAEEILNELAPDKKPVKKEALYFEFMLDETGEHVLYHLDENPVTIGDAGAVVAGLTYQQATFIRIWTEHDDDIPALKTYAWPYHLLLPRSMEQAQKEAQTQDAELDFDEATMTDAPNDRGTFIHAEPQDYETKLSNSLIGL